jgi:hypothetical protein
MYSYFILRNYSQSLHMIVFKMVRVLDPVSSVTSKRPDAAPLPATPAVPRICIAPLGGMTDAWRFALYAQGLFGAAGDVVRLPPAPVATFPDPRALARERSPPMRAAA